MTNKLEYWVAVIVMRLKTRGLEWTTCSLYWTDHECSHFDAWDYSYVQLLSNDVYVLLDDAFDEIKLMNFKSAIILAHLYLTYNNMQTPAKRVPKVFSILILRKHLIK